MGAAEDDLVFTYLREQYLRMGFPSSMADQLALGDADWHKVEELVVRIKAYRCEDPYRMAFLIAA